MPWVWEEHSREMLDVDSSDSDVNDEMRLVKVIRASVGKWSFQMKGWPIKDVAVCLGRRLHGRRGRGGVNLSWLKKW